MDGVQGRSVAPSETMVRNLQLLQKQSLQVTFKLSGTGYEAIENIGTGAYGVVCSAVHCATGQKVAIKKIPDIFSMHAAYALRTYREIRILRHFRHENIIAIREILQPTSDNSSSGSLKDVYVVLDLMESDLHRIIYSKQALTDDHVRYFLYQILRGLKYVHSANVIHRDLKPSNLLVNENCDLKIGDFGMARGLDLSKHADDLSNLMLTQYVATRWYRAPELVVSYKAYGAKIDVWSVGCIFAELLRRKYLFPGKDVLSQLSLIINTLGSPSQQFLESLGSETTQGFLNKMGRNEPKPWSEICPGASSDALDLLSRMLVIDPGLRISVTAALEHPYLAKFRDPDDEPVCLPPFNFDFEKELEAISNSDYKKDRLREKIYDEILALRRPKHHKQQQRVLTSVADVAEFPSFPAFFDAGGDSIAPSVPAFPGTATAAAAPPRAERSVYDELGDFFLQLTGAAAAAAPGAVAAATGGAAAPSSRSSLTSCTRQQLDDAGSLFALDGRAISDQCATVGSSSFFDNPLLAANVSSDLSAFDGRAAVQSATSRASGVRGQPTAGAASYRQAGMGSSTGNLQVSTALPSVATTAIRRTEDGNGDSGAALYDDVCMPSAKLVHADSDSGGSSGSISDATAAAAAAAGGDVLYQPSMMGVTVSSAIVSDREEHRAEAVKDAKTLLREALLKSHRHKEAGAAPHAPPKDEKKPATTAYQRQKEREEKRKQKLEKAKLKKKKDQQSTVVPMLTKEDMEMLERWKKMQKPSGANTSAVAQAATAAAATVAVHSASGAVQGDSIAVTIRNLNAVATAATTSTATGRSSNSSEAFADGTITSDSMRTLEQKAAPAAVAAAVPASIPAPTAVPAGTVMAAGRTQPAAMTRSPVAVVNAGNIVLVSHAQSQQPHPLLVPRQISSSDAIASLSVAAAAQASSNGIVVPQPYIAAPAIDRTGATAVAPAAAAFGAGTAAGSAVNLLANNRRAIGTIGSVGCSTAAYQSLPSFSAHSVEQNGVQGSAAVVPVAPAWTPSAADFRSDRELAAITTRFSRQQMDDTLPPILAMTPRGTGGGYGVGCDMESMLGEAFYADPQSAAMDSAPLSASLIADWMDVTANVGPIDLEALQQELELTFPLPDFVVGGGHSDG